jgi:ABC-type phosphate/phosphonate transport system substrate-binding protein
MKHGVVGVGLVVAIVWGTSVPWGEPVRAETSSADTIRISLASSLFLDTPDSLVKMLSRPMMLLMEKATGLTGQLQPSGDAATLARQLENGATDLAVFHGFEFAWVQHDDPKLKPLLLILNQQSIVYANLVVQDSAKMTCCDDLKGQTLAIPKLTRAHCFLFLDQCCSPAKPKDYFGRTLTPNDAEDALDDVVDGNVEVALIDKIALDAFSHLKPNRAKKLRILKQSEPFPAVVIAYRSGMVSAKKLDRFREGMIQAHQNPSSRDLLSLCRITRFAPVPESYSDQLKASLKAYPPPKK